MLFDYLETRITLLDLCFEMLIFNWLEPSFLLEAHSSTVFGSYEKIINESLDDIVLLILILVESSRKMKL